MTLTEDTLATLSGALPRPACPSEIGIGDVVEFRHVPLPVIVIGSELKGDVPDLYREFTWISQARTSNNKPVMEGQSVPERGEVVVLRARCETVRSDQIIDGDVLLFDDHESAYGLVHCTPRMSRPDVLDIAWTSGADPSGLPRTIGFLQYAPSRMVRRAPRGVAL